MKKPKIEYVEVAEKISVDLAYPLTVDGETLATVALVPPSIAAVTALAIEPPGPVDIVVAITGLAEPVVEALRWPDVEAILRVAIGAGILPPDLAALDVEGAETEAAPVSPAPTTPPVAVKRADPPVETEPSAGALVDFFEL